MEASVGEILELLTDGDVELLGLMPNASNYTFAATITKGEARVLAVYKPRDGESPLWDFPDGTLYSREVAAFVVSEAMGFRFVPPTIARDGPHGLGSVQLFIDAGLEDHYLSLRGGRHDDIFRRVAAFDVVVNNADRKSSHCLLEHGTGRIWVVDHGVCFHVDDKLRTVIWDYVGEPLDEVTRDGITRLLDQLDGTAGEMLARYIARDEIDALRARADDLLRVGTLPEPPEDRRAYPWPPI